LEWAGYGTCILHCTARASIRRVRSIGEFSRYRQRYGTLAF
jgi:hypothetical protein